MDVVAVSGAGSDSGKTTLVVALLQAFSGWGALKTSPAGPAPHDHGDHAAYELVIDPGRLMSPGTDTRSYLEAGALRAAWLISRTPVDDRAVAEVARHFAPCRGLIVEGGSLAGALSPGRRYLIARAGVEVFKTDTAAASLKADVLLLNAPRGTDRDRLARTRRALE